MLQALLASGLPARFSDDAGDYLCNFTLFQLVRQAAAPAVGFLHVPQVVEFADGASFTLAQVDQAVRASLTAFAGALSSPVRRPAA
jgi:pyrrolidone-carboxylate peptidase